MKIKQPENDKPNIVTRNVTAEAFQFAVYAFYDYILRSEMQFRFEMTHDSFFQVKQLPVKNTELFRYMYDIAETDLIRLKHQSSPIAKVITPQMQDVWHPQFANSNSNPNSNNIRIANTKVFKTHFMDKTAISSYKLNQIRAVGGTLTAVSLGVAMVTIMRSREPAYEFSHQVALMSSALTAGYTAASKAVRPCLLTGVYAPVCVAAVALTAGVLGTEGAEAIWEFSKNNRDSVLFKRPVKFSQAHASEGPDKESTVSVANHHATENNSAVSNLLAAMNACNSAQNDLFRGEILNSCLNNMNTLHTSHREFTASVTNNLRSVNLSDFTRAPVDITYSDVVHYQTALANRFYMSSRAHMARPSRGNSDFFSFFSGNDGGYDGGGYMCDSRFQDCSSFGSDNCRDSDAGKCKSSLF